VLGVTGSRSEADEMSAAADLVFPRVDKFVTGEVDPAWAKAAGELDKVVQRASENRSFGLAELVKHRDKVAGAMGALNTDLAGTLITPGEQKDALARPARQAIAGLRGYMGGQFNTPPALDRALSQLEALLDPDTITDRISRG
jgi:hypothetical protein